MRSRYTKYFILVGLIVGLSESVSAQTVVVPDFRVDNAPAGIGSGAPAIQFLPNDRFVVVWADGRNPTPQIFANILDVSGGLVRSDYRLDDGVVDSWSWGTGPGAIARDTSGNFFVTYLNSVDLISYYGRIRKFLPNGDPAGPSVSIKESGATPPQLIQVSKGINEKIIISYIDGPSPGHIYYRFFDNNLSPLGSPVAASQTTPGSTAALAFDSSGNFLLAWCRMDSIMIGRLFDSDGNPRTGEFPIESTMTGGDYPVAGYNSAGNFIVAWRGVDYIYARVFDGNGNPLTPVRLLEPMGEPYEISGTPAVTVDDAGNFIITYHYGSDLTPRQIFGSIWGPNGAILEQFFPVTSAHANPLYTDAQQDVDYIGNGLFVVTWRDDRTDSNGDIYAKIMQNNHWVAPQGPIPAAGPVALAILAGLLGWAIRRRLVAHSM